MPGLFVPLDVNYADDDKIIDAGPMGERCTPVAGIRQARPVER